MTVLFSLVMNALMALTTPTPEPVVSVELTLQTRGVHKSILVTQKQTQVDINGKKQQHPTSVKQWQTILKSLKDVVLADLPTLPTDVSRSSVDAALQAHVRIITTTQTYESATYDHPSPPAVLLPLVKAVVASAPSATRPAFR